MPEPIITPTPAKPASVVDQPSPKAVVPDPKPKAKGEKSKSFVVVHAGVGPFVQGDKVDPSDLFPDVEDPEPMVQRLIDLEAIAPNAE